MTKPLYGGGSPNTFTAIGFSNSIVDLPFTCATVNQFVMVGGGDSNGFPQSAVRWSAIGDPTDWPTPGTDDARAKQAGEESLPNQFGVVTAVSGGDFYGYIFQERAITKATYVGGDIVFGFDTFEESRGCWEYNRRTNVDDMVFFESEFGYHMLQNDQIADIGRGVVDETYPPQKTLAGSGTHGQANQQNVVANQALDCVFFESQNLCYNYKTGQWSRLPAYSGKTFVQIDDASGIVGMIEITATGGKLFDQDGGTAQTATLETNSADLSQGGRSVINSVRPHINGGTTAVRVGVQDALSDSVTYSTGTALNSRTGASNFRGADNKPEGKFVRTEYVITGGFTTALGADIEFSSSGGNT